MPLVATRGAASAQGFGEFARVTPPIYIEDVFSTYLYTGNGSTQTVTNGIDLSGRGGLVWLKRRDTVADNLLLDTVRGGSQLLFSNLTSASTGTSLGWSFNSNGFNFTSSSASTNASGGTYASWTFREQSKFFDVVTYTGNGVAGRTVSHSLGSVPGCIIIKRTDAAMNWYVYHRYDPSKYLVLNQSAAAASFAVVTATSDTTFTLPADGSTNGNGSTYVAYLFAHDAGGFGAAGTDNVISCGSFNAASVTTTTLGYEPQWLMFKQSDGVGNWRVVDNMRGWPASGNPQELNPNLSAAETSNGGVNIISTGFTNVLGSGNWIYIAIRRGPMKTPTSGTSVFNLRAGADGTGTGNVADTTEESKIMKVDLAVFARRGGSVNNFQFADKLRGFQNADNPPVDSLTTPTLKTSNADSEATSGNALYVSSENNSTVRWRSDATGGAKIAYAFRRAPGFFDEVCYTGTGSATTFNHNLTVVPELMIVKSRNNATNWAVYCAYLGGANPANRYVWLNSSNGFGGTAVYWNDTAPTSTVFTVGTTASTNTSSYTYVNYLFATVAGVSKVGSYTGTGALQTINCGFASGARFVLIKRTDSTGDWYVWDSARGISSSTDPYLTLNTTAAEVTSTNWVDTASTGFQVTAAGGNLVNTNGGTYIFLAIA